MKDLLNSFPHVGKVVWLGIRPERRAEVEVVQQVNLDVEHGVSGDHFQGASESTLKQKAFVQKPRDKWRVV